METLLSYQLEDLLLFSPDVYFRSLELYNIAIWPIQPIAMALGILCLTLFYIKHPRAKAIAGFVLVLAWGWCGAVYHLSYHQNLNWMAFYYGWIFIAQALIFLIWSLYILMSNQENQNTNSPLRSIIGYFLFSIALIVTPFLGFIDGPGFWAGQVFGLSPLPTLLTTFAIAFLTPGYALPLMIIPFIYTIIGVLTSYAVGSVQTIFYLLIIGAGLTLSITERLKRNSKVPK